MSGGTSVIPLQALRGLSLHCHQGAIRRDPEKDRPHLWIESFLREFPKVLGPPTPIFGFELHHYLDIPSRTDLLREAGELKTLPGGRLFRSSDEIHCRIQARSGALGAVRADRLDAAVAPGFPPVSANHCFPLCSFTVSAHIAGRQWPRLGARIGGT
jgi:hypothetical protein